MFKNLVMRPTTDFFNEGIVNYFYEEKIEDSSRTKVVGHRNKFFVKYSGSEVLIIILPNTDLAVTI